MAYTAQSARRVRETTVQDGDVVDTTRRVDNPGTDAAVERDYKSSLASRVVWYVAGVVLTLLALRFVLALLGANPDSGLVSFVYSVTQPLVAPFFGVFGYNYTLGASRFESFTLLAMLIYALVAWGIARLVTLSQRARTDVVA